MEPLSAISVIAASVAALGLTARRVVWPSREHERNRRQKPLRRTTRQLPELHVEPDQSNDSSGGLFDIDICFIHGLSGDATSTWTCQNPSADESFFWPSQLVSTGTHVGKAFPRPRILRYEYETDVNSVAWLTERTLWRHSSHLLEKLCDARAKDVERPLLFVAHSLGGLLVKSALISARDVGISAKTQERQIYTSTFGIISFGTPQCFAENPPLDRSFGRVYQLPKDKSLPSPTTDNDSQIEYFGSLTWKEEVEILSGRLEEYKSIARRIPEIFCYESSKLRGELILSQLMTTPPPLKPSRARCVNTQCRIVPIQRRHTDLAKFSARDQELLELANYISVFYENRQGLRDELKSELSTTREPKISYQLILKGGFKLKPELPPRGEFEVEEDPEAPDGQELLPSRLEYLDLITNRLDKHRLAILTGAAGNGKTTLAREYAYRQLELPKEEQPTSIFWLDADSKPSLEKSFLNIFHQLHAHYLSRDDTSFVSNITLDEDHFPSKEQDRKVAIRAVLEWFCFPDNTNWLLIYDDVDSEDESYLDEFLPADFLLPTTPTRGRIIKTRRGPDLPDDRGGIYVGGFRSDGSGLDRDHKYSGPQATKPSRSPSLYTSMIMKILEYAKRQDSSPAFFGPSSDSVTAPSNSSDEPSEPILVRAFTRTDSLKPTKEPTSNESNRGEEHQTDEDLELPTFSNDDASDSIDPFAYASAIASSLEVEQVEGVVVRPSDLFKNFPKELRPWLKICVMLARNENIPIRLVTSNHEIFGLQREDTLASLKTLQRLGWAVVPQDSGNSDLDAHDSLATFQIQSSGYEALRRALENIPGQGKEYATLASKALIATIKGLDDCDDTFDTLSLEKTLLQHRRACKEHVSTYGRSIACEWDILAQLCEKHGLYKDAAVFYREVRAEYFPDAASESLQSRTETGLALTSGENHLPADIEVSSAQMWNASMEETHSDHSQQNRPVTHTKNSRAIRSELGLIRVQRYLGELKELEEKCNDLLQHVRSRSSPRPDSLSTSWSLPKSTDRYALLEIEILQELVQLKLKLEERQDAIRFSRDLVNKLEIHFGPGAAETIQAIWDLAGIHKRHGDYQGAQSLLKRAYMGFEQLLSNSSMQTVAVLNDLAHVYMEQGDVKRAHDSFEEVMVATQKRLGDEHIETAWAMLNLANVLDMTPGDPHRADKLYDKAITAAERLGTESLVYKFMKDLYERRKDIKKSRKTESEAIGRLF